MGLRDGIANMMDFIGQYAGQYGLIDKKLKADEAAKAQAEQDRLLRDFKEYNMWTNPNDPIRQLLAAKYPGMALAKMTPQQFLGLKAQGVAGRGGGGFNFGAPSAGPVIVDE